ncbi:hypothetical protein [Pseudoroseomonas cervicalis]|uniref:hypothetical protein n=1 Tax=Teichococcus cervicalis TaxID=204525 RepID=UPI0022F168AE|nr:hypothetical protein [Pseudoroseomonas cervicalis]WBV45386.1 hypothetical protein PFY06_20355 [Pseudoroseomonas cervicalis]
MAQDKTKKDAVPPPAQDPKQRHGMGLGELTGMMTGHSTRDPDTTRPGDKTTGPGELGNFLKNQKE